MLNFTKRLMISACVDILKSNLNFNQLLVNICKNSLFCKLWNKMNNGSCRSVAIRRKCVIEAGTADFDNFFLFLSKGDNNVNLLKEYNYVD